MNTAILKDHDFDLITEFVKPDNKKRVTLGARTPMGAFNIYLNKFGQFILDPVKAVSASEAWLYEDKKALASLKKGLKESAAGNVSSLGSFAHYIKD